MTKHFVDSVGNYLGGFDGAEPPEGAVEVLAPEDGRQTYDHPGNFWLPYPPPPTIPELISLQLKNINAQCEQAIAEISEGYPPSEVLSWPKQEAEARAWLADNNKATPLIDALSSERGVAKADLVARIIAKADAFAVLSGQLIGKRQGLEDQLMAMKAAFEDPELDDPTPAEIEAVVW